MGEQHRASRLLVEGVRNPRAFASLDPVEISGVLDEAQRDRLLGWVAPLVEANVPPAAIPVWLSDRLCSARSFAAQYEQSLRWEIGRVRRALGCTGIRWVLLKGAAYVACGLPPGRGRPVADIDILVDRPELARVESILGEHGWRQMEMTTYDARYYRTWMHELPPLVHAERGSIVDVHHAILPTTSRLKPSSDRLLAQARPIGASGEHVLSPAHMVLHGAAHLFHDGEVAGALRDLVDLDSLLRVFGAEPGFWEAFTEEARQLQLTRPAYYALRYTQQWFDTPIPSAVVETMNAWKPNPVVGRLMDLLVQSTLPSTMRDPSAAAALALYVRSHWLRMPPWLLAPHLLRKALAG